MIYYKRSRIQVVVNAIIAVTIIVLFVTPVYILYRLLSHDTSDRTYGISVAVLLLFIIAFSAVLHLFTRARRHEVLGGAAA